MIIEVLINDIWAFEVQFQALCRTSSSMFGMEDVYRQ